MIRLRIRALASLLILFLVMAAVLFAAAGTLSYWQGWVFLFVYFSASLAITLDLMWRDPALLERRMSGGPFAEKEPAQRVIMAIVSICFIALIVMPGLDHRWGWSAMRPVIVVIGDLLVVLGFAGIMRVFRENSFTAATIELAEDQRVISSGPYAIVRHPMYAAALPMLTGIPIALGSWRALLIAAAMLPVLIWRLLDEERFLTANLRDYCDYRQRVRYRLLPPIW
jgi:protein-S-isoprenylcysteine O-methyltransferase Ste14